MGQKIGYIRVSTVDQNTARQLEGIELDKTFVDKISGKNAERPQLRAMLDYAREGDTIVVHSLDRLARNLDDLRRIVKEATEKGIQVEFLKENLSFNNKADHMSQLLLSVMGAFAEFERNLILERQREGIALAKKQGKYKGRKPKLDCDQRNEIKKLVADGAKIMHVANQFKISRDTVYKAIRN